MSAVSVTARLPWERAEGKVRVTVLGTSEKVDVEITWAGGHRTAAQVTRSLSPSLTG